MRQDTLLDCPVCGLPAEVVARFRLDGAPRPVEHVKLVCLGGHWFTLPVDGLALRATFRPRSSIVRRIVVYLKDLWREYDYAGRRMLEIQLGVSMR